VHRIALDKTSRDITVVTASGELDAFVERELEAAFEAASEGGPVVIDLAAVSFMDSTALGLLVRAVRSLDGKEGAVRVVLPHGTARRIFELTTLDRVLPVSASRDDALSELAAAS
jgi:anti-sigma B factor antagonist